MNHVHLCRMAYYFSMCVHACVNRNDLWALGCTLYQMLAGSSPFKDASEWLTFQRIIARDLRFPDYFCNEAKDLIDRLLVSSKWPYADYNQVNSATFL